jgi:hypothetical protein
MTLPTAALGAQSAIPLVVAQTPLPTGQFLLVETGTFVANGASSVTVANANVTATSIILISLNTVGGTVGAIPAVKTITVGTGFTVAGTAADTSTYNYIILG